MTKGFVVVATIVAIYSLMNKVNAAIVDRVNSEWKINSRNFDEGTCGVGVSWILSDEGTLTVYGTGEMTNFSTKFDEPWYSNRYSIKTVLINSGVKSVGNRAFYDCTSLERVTISDTVSSIAVDAFNFCTFLVSIDVDESNSFFKSIDGVLFDHSLKTLIRYPAGKPNKSYLIPGDVKTIGSYAFSECATLENITVQKYVISIRSSALLRFKSLTYIEVNEDNTKFRSVDGVLFNQDLSALIRYPPGSDNVGYVVPDSVTSIESYGFEYCTRLKHLTVGKNVTSIQDSAFLRCNNLISFGVTEGNEKYSSVDGVLFTDGLNTLFRYPAGNTNTSYSIPDSVTSVGGDAFYGCAHLTTIFIPENVKSVGNYAFAYCSDLANITLPKNVSAIGDYAFYDCTSLTSIIIPNSLTSVGSGTFYHCSNLSSVTIPDTVTSIENSAFYNCDSLTTITLPDSIMSIGNNAFKQCSSLTSVYYQGSQTFPQSSAFSECSSLKNVCVSPDYEDTEFCGMTVNSESDSCKEFQKKFNHCYKGAYIDDEFVAQKRRNATELEIKKSNGCVQYQCQNETGLLQKKLICECKTGYSSQCNEGDGGCEYEIIKNWDEMVNHCYEAVCNGGTWIVEKRQNATVWEGRNDGCGHYECNNSTGAIAWSLCNSSAEKTQTCVDSKCIQNNGNVEKNKVPVLVELDGAPDVAEMNPAEILEVINDQCSVDIKDMKVGWETDEQGNIVRIILYVDDEQTASIIARTIEGLRKGEQCEYGLLCKTKSVRVLNERDISGSSRNHCTFETIIVILFIITSHSFLCIKSC